MTYQVSADYAQENFEQIIQKATKESQGVVIVRGNQKFVLIEQSKIKDLQNTAEFEQLPNLFKNIVPSEKKIEHLS